MSKIVCFSMSFCMYVLHIKVYMLFFRIDEVIGHSGVEVVTDVSVATMSLPPFDY